MASRSAEEMVAYALEMDPELLPYAPELLADIDVLGSDVELIVAAIAGLAPGPTTVVDLGAGKGAVAVAIARELGLSVHGIELFEPFVDIARQAAEAAGVTDRCRFSHGDIATMAAATSPADVAVFAALGDVLGPLDVTVGIIREYVRPGGFIVINDSCRRDGSTESFPGFDTSGTLAESRTWLTAHGDELVAEMIEGDADGEPDDGIDEGALMATRAHDLARRHPELESQLRAFVDDQLSEYEYLDRHTVSAVWVLRRS